MDVAAAAAISAGSGLAGAVIGAGSSFLVQRAERESRERADLVRELAALGFAIDMLGFEVDRLPRRTVVARVADEAINEQRLPNLNYAIEWTHRRTIGRDAFRAFARFVDVTNRVLVIAPEPVLESVQDFAGLLGRLEDRKEGEAWRREWQAARERYARVCRETAR